MDSKIIIIIGLVVVLSILGTAIMMNFLFSDAIQLEKEQKALEKRLREHGDRMGDQCDPGDTYVTYDGHSWCEENMGDISQTKRDCVFAQEPNYVAWCEYYGVR
jgi:hypothetical protein